MLWAQGQAEGVLAGVRSSVTVVVQVASQGRDAGSRGHRERAALAQAGDTRPERGGAGVGQGDGGESGGSRGEGVGRSQAVIAKTR